MVLGITFRYNGGRFIFFKIMHKHRFLVDTITRGGFAFLKGREVRHARKSLRLKAGDRVILFTNDGQEFEAEVLRYHSKEDMELKVLEEVVRDVEMSKKIHVVLGLCRSKNFELALQKCTELGVASFIPLQTDRSILKLEDAERKLDRWNDIVLDATKQSTRTSPPEVMSPQTLESLISNFGLNELNTLFASVKEGVLNLHDAIENVSNENNIYILVGPEGGFSDREIEFAKSQTWNFVSLGKRVLRVETAAIFMSSVLAYELDE